MKASLLVLELGATDPSESYAQNTHRVVIGQITPTEFIGWPDPTDARNSNVWKPGIDAPLHYPKFAWREIPR